jgi:hypothetical protein
MTAFNVVRFRVKAGNEQQVIDTYRSIRPAYQGYLGGDLIQTGERSFCIIGKWRNMNALVAARPQMIVVLDRLREMLEDLGNGLGVTDPVAGETVASFTPIVKKKAAKKKAGKKKAAKKKSKKKAPRKSKAKTKVAKKSQGRKKTSANAGRSKRGKGRTAKKRA